MRVFAIETSAINGSVAALVDDRLQRELALGPDQKTAQALAPAMARLLQEVGWSPAQMELIAVTQGPGSFTGLRIGVTTAKVLAYATGAAVVGVDTLHVLAAQAPPEARLIYPVLDAQRRQLFTATWRRDGDAMLTSLQPTRVIDREEFLQSLEPQAWITGTGIHGLLNQLPQHIRAAAPALWIPQAATVGRIGYRLYQSGQHDDACSLLPHYYRPSAAEEKWAQKGG